MKLESFVFDAAPPCAAGVNLAELLNEIEAVKEFTIYAR